MKDMSIDTIAASRAATVTALSPVARFSLRGRGDAVAALSAALGVELLARVGARAQAGARDVLCLGPDEWMIHAPEGDAAAIINACAGVAAPHALVEVSDRELSYAITGPQAAELLTLGCPRDPDSIAVGEGRRTVFDGATVILWRDGRDAFRMDVWRSFAPHVTHLLATGCRELALG
ncbi:sarcosine oxidase subunit gamma [Meridianimarinicoccus sp. RP-17]|uniref:sarcosine oxidase subunit gamma n=1 Tax=Meridianimarinicoccus zhengii TaxID=2056810 RepID=UPI001C9B1998|nr:sarcosine oxidase subunit gamma family protein [Phycocomes zhengii]